MDQAGNETDGPAKRQRKWKSDGLQEAEPKVVSVAPTTPKDIPQTSNVKRNFSSMSDSVSDGSPKDRIGEFLSCFSASLEKT